MKRYYTYILLCSDNSYYTGITNNIDRRVYEHNKGINANSYTFKKRPVKLIYYEVFIRPLEAIKREKQIKGWTREKKEALIKTRWKVLKNKAECKNVSNCKNYQD